MLAQRALILASGFRLQYRVLRCAAMCFSKVYVLGESEAMTLRLSTACAGVFAYKRSFAGMDPAAIGEINALCKKLSIDFVLPSCAETTRFLAAYGRQLTTPHFPVPSQQVFDALDDKWRFAALCEHLGLPHPKTACFADYPELLNAAQGGCLTFPMIIKPLRMWGSFGVMKIDSLAQMPNEVEYRPILAENYIPGRDFCAFFLCREGRVSRTVSYARSERGVAFGSHPDVDRYARVLIERLGYSGVIGFDVRQEPDGSIHFIECNPRFWYRMELASIVGLNFIEAGCSQEPPVAPQPLASDGIVLPSPRGLLRSLFRPWRLNRHDVGLLKYLARDPLINARMAVRSLLGASKAAGGQIFLWILLCGISASPVNRRPATGLRLGGAPKLAEAEIGELAPSDLTNRNRLADPAAVFAAACA